MGFPGDVKDKESIRNAGDARDMEMQGISKEDPLEEKMATYPSILVNGKFPLTEVPGELQSMGLQRVGHD